MHTEPLQPRHAQGCRAHVERRCGHLIAVVPDTLCIATRPPAFDMLCVRIAAALGNDLAVVGSVTGGASSLARLGSTRTSATWVVDGETADGRQDQR